MEIRHSFEHPLEHFRAQRATTIMPETLRMVTQRSASFQQDIESQLAGERPALSGPAEQSLYTVLENLSSVTTEAMPEATLLHGRVYASRGQ